MTRNQADDKRTQILHGVWAVVADRGLAAVSFRTVAAHAGVSVGRIQHYFGTKADLVRASVELLITAAEQETDVPEGENGLWELLSHAIPRAETSRVGVALFYSYVAAGVADPGIASTLASAKAGLEEDVARRLAQLGLSDAACEARHLVATADGLTLRVLLGGMSAEEALTCLRRQLERTLLD